VAEIFGGENLKILKVSEKKRQQLSRRSGLWSRLSPDRGQMDYFVKTCPQDSESKFSLISATFFAVQPHSTHVLHSFSTKASPSHLSYPNIPSSANNKAKLVISEPIQVTP
jgi:hypothetical protein